MRVWITSCLVLFGMVELYQWFRHFTLPFPIFILGGALLAIASNYDKLGIGPYQNSALQEPPLVKPVNSPNRNSLNQSQSKPAPQTRQSISFTIERSSK